VARDRKRAKQRRERRGGAAAGRAAATGAPAPAPTVEENGSGTVAGADGAPAVSPTQPVVRADVPGALDHASAEVDEFDAALVAGAGGVPVAPDTLSESEIEAEAELEGDLSVDEIQESGAPPPPGGSGGGRVGAGADGGGGGGVTPEQASGAPLRGGSRAVGFLRASWAELQRVQWPDRRQVFQATAVVLGFVAIAGAYLGLADYVAKEIVELIL
jgi:preprotein translocase subunit SecE